MKVALVQPKIPDGNYLPSLGLLYIASVLRDNGFDVRLFDENYNEDVLPGIRAFAPDVVGITAVTAAIKRSLRLARAVKAELGVKTVLGGAHPTAMPEEIILDDGVDFVVAGEGEHAMLALCNSIANDCAGLTEIKNLYFKEGGRARYAGKAVFLTGEELDALPYPAYDMLDLEYVFANSMHGLFSMGKRILPIMTSRGCPQVCTFCCRMMGYNVRERSPKSVIDEIRHLHKNYGIDELYIEDDNFCSNKVRAHEILDLIIEARLGIRIKFANGLRADSVDEALLVKIKKAGGYWVGFGVESGSERVLGLMKKNLDLELTRINIRKAKSLGFFVGSNLIVGYPGETLDDLRQSLKYFQSLGLDSCAIVSLIPFPRTHVHALCKKEGYLTKYADDYDNYFFKVFNANILVATPFLSADEALRFIRYFFIRFYTRPDRFLRILRMSFKRRVARLFVAGRSATSGTCAGAKEGRAC